MAFNGSGTFLINSTGQPVVTATTISSTVFNALTTDLAGGLTDCITKDGQSTPTANIKMGGYKITGIAQPTGSGDALAFGLNISVGTATLSGALTYGGVTLSNAVTGTGNMVLGTAPTFASTITYGGVTLTAAVSGTGAMVLATSPTLVTPVLGAATGTSLLTSGNIATSSGNINTTSGSINSGTFITDVIGNVRNIPLNSQSGGYTLVASDNGKWIDVTSGGVTIPDALFAVGNNVTIFNATGGSITITAGITTLYLAGSGSTGNRTLASYGVATVYFRLSTNAVISGTGLT
jgi:hypothetical protein